MEATSDSPPAGCELLILHTPEAQEWAEYLDAILRSMAAFRDGAIRSYAVSPGDRPAGYDLERFHRSQCVVLLLTAALLDLLGDEDLLWALERLLQPPRRVVVLLCGVAEELVPEGSFLHWEDWSKLHSDDEPAVYIQTVLAAMEDDQQEEVYGEREATTEASDEVCAQTASEVAEETEAEEYLSAEEGEPVPEPEPEPEPEEEPEPDLIVDPSPGDSAQPDESSVVCSTCLTVQPNRIPCGERTTLYIILLHKLDIETKIEVVFSSEHGSPQHVAATIVNEYTLSVIAPDMPPGEVSLSLLANHSSVSLTTVTYYTYMDAVSRHLNNATSPIEFICQAFNITCNKTESVDNMLTDMLKSRMPLGGLQLFGIEQVETDNMSTYQRNEDLPTLLHFAAKYGLRKLTTTLLHCPGALQAISVMNRHGEYPNKLADRSGFTDLRRFMDEFVQTADTVSSDPQDDDSSGVYMLMAPGSEDILTCSEHTGEIYESMLDINPECAEDLYEVMTKEDQNPEEAMLRTFFLAKQGAGQRREEWEHCETEDTKDIRQNDAPQHKQEEREEKEEEEEDLEQEQYNLEDGPLYNTFQEDIYHMVDDTATYHIRAINRPPAPMPRPESSVSLDNKPYITRVFSDHQITPPTRPTRRERPAAEPGTHAPCSSATFDAYSGMKTPGQRQLIALQERVKLELISVNEAVQEFKAWQREHERSNSLRCQQENLDKLRRSINRRHKERKKTGKRNVDLEITAPIQSRTDPEITAEYSLYDYSPRMTAPPPPVSHSIQRGNWKTGSTSSTSSTESNRLSTHSILSTSSGTEPDFEDTMDILPPPPRPPRPHHVVTRVPSRSPPPPPHLPPPVPQRNQEPVIHERYISCPTRAVPRRPSAPPLPRRQR
ncbi:phosphoinositide 3-kinase adapter protein 1 isoform X1 [Gadus macrocephalus]|uniref:phosphoinositide 3-kinase adapter protein 1 isoform X1 n=2 Tax=Gadus macrocephalus TaxID=80720 RepID=UPI0028CB709A|nr:phosphoinositide 3-kinase adapter protein 1 isoform X1 [Gadus macrocephalus]